MAPQTADPASGRAGGGAGFGSRARPGPLTAVAVSARFLPHFGPFQVPVDGLPGLPRAPHLFVHYRSLGLALMPRYQDRLIPQHTLDG